jgi:hypothetical protein
MPSPQLRHSLARFDASSIARACVEAAEVSKLTAQANRKSEIRIISYRESLTGDFEFIIIEVPDLVAWLGDLPWFRESRRIHPHNNYGSQNFQGARAVRKI